MKCPVCNIDLLHVKREEVDFDQCSNCKGLWLNRTALNKLMARSEEDLHSTDQMRLPGSSSMKHARRDEDWVDYYPDEQEKLPKSFLLDVFGD